jgi:hypothetical protein
VAVFKHFTTNLYNRKHNPNEYHVYVSLTLTSAPLVFYASSQALACLPVCLLPASAAWLSRCFCTPLTGQPSSLPFPASLLRCFMPLPASPCHYLAVSLHFPACLCLPTSACLPLPSCLVVFNCKILHRCLCLPACFCVPVCLPTSHAHLSSCLPVPACFCLPAFCYLSAPPSQTLAACLCLTTCLPLPACAYFPDSATLSLLPGCLPLLPASFCPPPSTPACLSCCFMPVPPYFCLPTTLHFPACIPIPACACLYACLPACLSASPFLPAS